MANEKKILGVIDHFGSGGSQRQFVHLMNGLARMGYKVTIFTYHESLDFFKDDISHKHIKIYSVEKKKIRWIGVVKSLRRVVGEVEPNFVISFLHIPNLLCEFLSFFTSIPCLIVSERTSRHDDKNFFIRYVRRIMHSRATKVVVNSTDHHRWLTKKFRWLAHRTACIYNGIDNKFFDAEIPQHPGNKLKFIGIGRIDCNKNPILVVESLILFAKKNGWCPKFEWIGRVGHKKKDVAYFEKVNKLIISNDVVKSSWTWTEESKDISAVLAKSHVLIHPSRYEGLPNVVCEALAMGRPVLASKICEHPYLVGQQGERGFLFQINDSKSLAKSIEELTSMTSLQWNGLSVRCRIYAEVNFKLTEMVIKFEKLLRKN